MSKIRFRPHHFLCTVGFEGKGYSESFVENFTSIANRLRNSSDGDDIKITVIEEATDSICAPCPNRKENQCETEVKIRKLDTAHAKILELHSGDTLSWGEAKNRIREKMTLEKFHDACAPCSWKRAGICETALKRLKGLASVLIVFSFLFSANDSFAKKNRTPATTLTAAESLRLGITGKMKAPKAAKALEKASALLDKEKWSEAIVAASPAEKDGEFSDHALAIKGLASQREAEHLIDEDKKIDWKKIESLSTRSIEAWTRILESHLYSPWWGTSAKEIGKSELNSALAHGFLKQNSQSSKLFEKAFQRLQLENGLNLIRPHHVKKYGELCLKKETEICTAWIIRLSNLYSKNSAESKVLANLYPDVVERAKPFFANSKITTGYKQKDADEVAFDAAYPLVVEENFGDAVDAFKKFLEEFPRSTYRYRARYWLAYALEKKKGPEEAKMHYEQLVRETPLTIYGLLSMFALKQEPEGRFKGNAPAFIDHDDEQTPIEAARLIRAKKLLAAKADKLAALDIKSIKSRDSAPGPYLLWLASFAASSGSHLTAFSILSELISRMDESIYTTDGLDLVFPVVEWPIIEKTATAAGIDPILILSLIKQESAFERDASSSVGASGYMQLMPFTASDVEPDVERRELIDAETNIRIGSKYLKKLIDRYKGNIALALSGYNAGPTATDRWIREGRAARSFMEYVEQIPYKETRDYVATIYRNYVWYQFRLKGTRVNAPDLFWPSPVPPGKNAPLEKTIDAP